MSDAKVSKPGPVWKNLGIRFLSAVFLVLVCLAPFYFGGWIWAALVALFGGRMLYEWVRMSDKDATLLAYAIPIIGFLVAIVYTVQFFPTFISITLIATVALAAAERLRRGGAGWAVLGALYIIVPSLLIIALRGNVAGFDTLGFQRLFFIILIVVAADVGAYFGGSYLKGPKLSPKLSPNKTWSGVISGLLLAVIAAAVFAMFTPMNVVAGMLLAVPLVVASVLGDLFESGVKRRLNVKDTGDLLPGHGGLLDRLDSLMAAVFVAAIFLTLFPQIWLA